jgi:hypothetical protein
MDKSGDAIGVFITDPVLQKRLGACPRITDLSWIHIADTQIMHRLRPELTSEPAP